LIVVATHTEPHACTNHTSEVKSEPSMFMQKHIDKRKW
jgi:hypothetical protein